MKPVRPHEKFDDARKALAERACILENHPSHDLLCIGVTGTNGKTTSAYLLESILRQAGLKPALIGTIENRFETKRIKSTHTTPDPVQLQKLLSRFKKLGAKSICMEVSSHALDQHRTLGTRFRAALFTNLTQDHLDYHKTMESYFEAKSKFFLDYTPEIIALHIDDEYGKKLAARCRKKGLSFISFGKKADVSYQFSNASRLNTTVDGISGEIVYTRNRKKILIHIHSKLLGEFNMQNIAGAVAVALKLGIPRQDIQKGITKAQAVPGRLERVPNKKNLTVLVDYAHTPDALKNVLKTLKPLTKGKLVCIFGCGGDRDPGKRPLMGEIVTCFSDYTIVTSDNPRTEDPARIIKDIGLIAGSKVEIIPDRKRAIKRGIGMIKPCDTLLIAGKGHEDYQIIGKQKIYFDDRKVAAEQF